MAARLCPTCRRSFDDAAPGGKSAFRPFCSERCRTADLGNWLDGNYRISAPVSEEDLDTGLPDGRPTGDDQDRDPDVN